MHFITFSLRLTITLTLNIIVLGKSAGTQGPMVTHTADCSDCDFRIAKVPSRDWGIGELRPMYLYKSK